MRIISESESKRRQSLQAAALILTDGDAAVQASNVATLLNFAVEAMWDRGQDANQFLEIIKMDALHRLLSPQTPEEYLLLYPEDRAVIESGITHLRDALPLRGNCHD